MIFSGEHAAAGQNDPCCGDAEYGPKLAEGEVSLRVDGDGPLKGALVICSGSGDLRGYALEPRLWLDDAEANLFPYAHWEPTPERDPRLSQQNR